MKTHRGLFLGLGLVALLGVSAREVKAETMTLTVELNGSVIYTNLGGPTSVSATSALNSLLLGTGYTFTNLGGSSNFTGSTGDIYAYVSDSGTLSRLGGTGGTLTVIVSESGFMSPASAPGSVLQTTQTATFSGATGTSSQTYMGSLNSITQGTTPATLYGTTSLQQGGSTVTTLGANAYSTPFTLTNTTTMTLGQSSGSQASNVFTGTTSITGVVPEPASLIMMLTGMPLPLVVMGLLRRRRAAA